MSCSSYSKLPDDIYYSMLVSNPKSFCDHVKSNAEYTSCFITRVIQANRGEEIINNILNAQKHVSAEQKVQLQDVATRLLSQVEDVNPFDTGVKTFDAKKIETTINQGGNWLLNVPNKNKQTPLHNAVQLQNQYLDSKDGYTKGAKIVHYIDYMVQKGGKLDIKNGEDAIIGRQPYSGETQPTLDFNTAEQKMLESIENARSVNSEEVKKVNDAQEKLIDKDDETSIEHMETINNVLEDTLAGGDEKNITVADIADDTSDEYMSAINDLLYTNEDDVSSFQDGQLGGKLEKLNDTSFGDVSDFQDGQLGGIAEDSSLNVDTMIAQEQEKHEQPEQMKDEQSEQEQNDESSSYDEKSDQSFGDEDATLNAYN